MADAGMHVPAIEQRPTTLGLEWIWEAYINLNTCRQIGMSVGPIPWSAVEQYVVSHRLSDDEAYVLHMSIREMDSVYLEHMNRKHNG
jgi:hypothetical protein